MQVRTATLADCAAIASVVRSSILELCGADHQGDAAVLGSWLANKTPENVAKWLSNPDNSLLVVTDDKALIAAGCITRAGEITLNYVAPEARFRGASKALVGALEDIARRAGNGRCTLQSTRTAHRFYGRLGYGDDTPAIGKHGLTTYPMSKRL